MLSGTGDHPKEKVWEMEHRIRYRVWRCLRCGRPLLILLAILSAVLLSGGNALAQGTVATDKAVLEALYDATGGPNWITSTNWGSTQPLSEWHRVETDEDGRVTALRLVANGLSGEIPAELGERVSET